jgi:hypothetical protein
MNRFTPTCGTSRAKLLVRPSIRSHLASHSLTIDNSVPAFCERFSQGGLPPIRVLKMWEKSGFQFSFLDRSHTLVLLYILHMEYSRAETPKRDKKNKFLFSEDRRHMFKCFGTWVECCCNCRRKWNFTNSLGLVDASHAERDCVALKYHDAPWPMLYFMRRQRIIFEENRQRWLASPSSARFG